MRTGKISLLILTTLVFAATFVVAQDKPMLKALDVEAMQKLMDDSAGQAKVSIHPATGMARFIRLEPGSLRLPIPLKATGSEQAQAFFDEYGGVFGMTKANRELVPTKTFRDTFGGEHASFAQSYQDIPVFGAELRAHFKASGELYAVNGTFVPGIKLNPVPRLTADQAAQVAIAIIARPVNTNKQPRDLTEPKVPQGKASRISPRRPTSSTSFAPA